MGSVVIICNGEFPKKEYPLYLLRTADHIICCDNALRTFMNHSEKIFGTRRRPDVVIGDMDSLPKRLQKENEDIIIRVEEQETNDMSKAFHYVISHYDDIDTIHFLAATGKREDHTIGNLSLLMEYAKELKGKNGPEIDIVSDWSTAFAVTDTCSFQVGEGRAISIFSPDNTLKIKSDGLKWQTEGVTFDNWWKATLNKADKDEVHLEFSHPSIALIILN